MIWSSICFWSGLQALASLKGLTNVPYKAINKFGINKLGGEQLWCLHGFDTWGS